MTLQSSEFGLALNGQAAENFKNQLEKIFKTIAQDAKALRFPIDISNLPQTLQGLEELSKKIKELNGALQIRVDNKTGYLTQYSVAGSNLVGGISTRSREYSAETGTILGKSSTVGTSKAKPFNKELDAIYTNIIKYQKQVIDLEIKQKQGVKDYTEELQKAESLVRQYEKQRDKLFNATAKRYKSLSPDATTNTLISTDKRTKSIAAQTVVKEQQRAEEVDAYKKNQWAKAEAQATAQKAKAQSEYASALQKQYSLQEDIYNLEVQNNSQNDKQLQQLKNALASQEQVVLEKEKALNGDKGTVAEQEKLAALEQQHLANMAAIDTKKQNKDLQTRNQLENNYLDALQRQQRAEIELERMKTDPKHRYGSETLDSQQQYVDLLRQQTEAAKSQLGTKELSAEAQERLNRLEAQYKAEIDKANGSLVQQQGFLKSFVQNFKNTFKQVVTAGLSWKIWAAGVQTLRNAVQTVTKIDTAMVELKKVTDETDEAYSKFLTTAKTQAKALGATIDELIQSTAGFARLGYSLTEATKLAEVATVYTRVGDEIDNVEQATSVLVSTMKAFNMTADDSTRIIDVFNEVGNKFAVTSGGIGEALERSASSLMTAGNTFEESVGLVVAIDEVIQDSAKTGQALKTISMRLRNTAGQLEELDEDAEGAAESITKLQTQILNATKGQVNIMKDNENFKSTTQILTELSQVWGELTDVQRADLTRLIAGRQQGNAFNAVMTNMSKGVEATTVALNSQGSAMKEHEKWLNSIQGATYQFEASLQSLYSNLINSEVIKFLIHAADTIVSLVDTIHLLPLALNAIVAFGIPKLLSSGITHLIAVRQQTLANAQAISIATMNLRGFSAQEALELLLKKQLNLEEAIGNEEKLKAQLIAANMTSTEAESLIQLVKEEILRRQVTSAIRQQTAATAAQTAATAGETAASAAQTAATSLQLQKTSKGLGSVTSGISALASTAGGKIQIALMIISAIATGISLIKQYTDWLDSGAEKLAKNKDKAEELRKEFQETQKTVSDIEEKIKSNTETVQQITGYSENRTAAEQQTVLSIEEQNRKLQRQLKIQRELLKLQQQDQEEADIKVLNAIGQESSYEDLTGLLGIRPTRDSARMWITTDWYNPPSDEEVEQWYTEQLTDYYERMEKDEGAKKVLQALWADIDKAQEIQDLYEKGSDAWIAAEKAIQRTYGIIGELSIDYSTPESAFQEFFSAEQQTQLLQKAFTESWDFTDINDYFTENFEDLFWILGERYEDFVNWFLEQSQGVTKDFLEENATVFKDLSPEELTEHFKGLSTVMEKLSAAQKEFSETGNYNRKTLWEVNEALGIVKDKVGLTDEQFNSLLETMSSGTEEEVTKKLKTLAAQYVISAYDLAHLTDTTKQQIAADLKWLGIQADMDKMADLLAKKTELQTKLNLLQARSVAALTIADKVSILRYQQLIQDLQTQIDEQLELINLGGIEELPEKYSKLREKLDEEYEQGKISAKDYYNSLLSYYNKYIKGIKAYAEEEKSILKTLSKTQEKMIDEQQTLLKEGQAYIDYVYDQKIKAIEKEEEALEKANEQEELSLNLQKAKDKLKSAQQKNMRVYYEGIGWVWESDPAAVEEAQKDVTEAEQAITKNDLENQKEYFQTMKTLVDDAMSWTDVLKNKLSAEAIFGANFVEDIETNAAAIENILQKINQVYAPIALGKMATENKSLYSALSNGDTNVPSSVIDWIQSVIENPMKVFNAGSLSSIIGTNNQTINIQSIVLPNVTNSEEFTQRLQTIAQNR